MNTGRRRVTQQEPVTRSKVAAEDLFARDLRENTVLELGVDNNALRCDSIISADL